MTRGVHQALVHTCVHKSGKVNSKKKKKMQPAKVTVRSKTFFKYVRNKRRLKKNSSFMRWKGKGVVNHTHPILFVKMKFSWKMGIETSNTAWDEDKVKT